MFLAILLLLQPAPWAQNKDFTEAAQQKAFSTTLRMETKKGEKGTAVRFVQHPIGVHYLTCAHGLEKGGSVELESFAAKDPLLVVQKISARVVGYWPEVDLAVLRGDEPNRLGLATICPADRIPTGKNPLMTVGCSSGATPTIEFADGTQRRIHGRSGSYWELANRPVPGRSGGPAFDVNGNLVGICSGIGDGKGYFVHIEEIRRTLENSGMKTIFFPVAAADPASPPSKK